MFGSLLGSGSCCDGVGGMGAGEWVMEMSVSGSYYDGFGVMGAGEWVMEVSFAAPHSPARCR